MFGVILALICTEITLRVLAVLGKTGQLLPYEYSRETIERIAEGDTYIAFDQELGWSIRPGVRVEAADVVYQSNAAGIRSEREFERAAPPRTTRVVAVGESFTHCDDSNLDDCWTSRLETLWPRSEILNLGVPGYGTDQAYLRYRRDAQAFDHCAVVMGFMPDNVNRLVNRFRPFYQPNTGIMLPKPRFVLENDQLKLVPHGVDSVETLLDPSRAEQLLGTMDHWYYPNMFAPLPSDISFLMRLRRSVEYRRYTDQVEHAAAEERRLAWAYETREESYQLAKYILIQFDREVRAAGKTPVIVFLARKTDLVAERRSEDRIYQPLLDALRREHVEVIDTVESLGKEARAVGADRVMDKHYKGPGNRAVAEHLQKRLPDLVRPTCGG
ncbi:MAG: SGNH/GDSL hydrolase family protein [Chloroflexota bacterium]